MYFQIMRIGIVEMESEFPNHVGGHGEMGRVFTNHKVGREKWMTHGVRCEICGQNSESVGLILWECPLARNVWAIWSYSKLYFEQLLKQ